MTQPLHADEIRPRVELLMAHLWMVRTFLKHAPEIEEDLERMRIPRAIFDFVRAVETRLAAKPPEDLLKMLRKKLPQLRAAADQLAAQLDAISTHTNFQMAAASLTGCVRELEMLAGSPTASRPEQ